MTHSLDRTNKETEFTKIYYLHVDTVYRICFTYLKNTADTEDAVQEVFIKLLNYHGTFDSEEHRKAWLIVTASNFCKNYLKHWWRHHKNIENYTDLIGDTDPKIDEIMNYILDLPDKYKTVVYLYYYEGYNSNQIASMLHKPGSTIRTYLSTAKKLLKKELEKG